MNSQGQVTKQEADYTDKSSSPAEHRCGICESIRHCPGEDHTCTLVEGPVVDMGGCKLFSKDLIKWANDKITLAEHPSQKII